MKTLILVILSATLAHAGCGPVTSSKRHPADSWEWTLESGYLWNIGNNTDIDYEIIPTQLTLRSPIVWTWWQDEAGAKLVVRNRLSALFETITKGPEDYYIGIAGAPSLEYWLPSQKTAFYFSIGAASAGPTAPAANRRWART